MLIYGKLSLSAFCLCFATSWYLLMHVQPLFWTFRVTYQIYIFNAYYVLFLVSGQTSSISTRSLLIEGIAERGINITNCQLLQKSNIPSLFKDYFSYGIVCCRTKVLIAWQLSSFAIFPLPLFLVSYFTSSYSPNSCFSNSLGNLYFPKCDSTCTFLSSLEDCLLTISTW